MTSSKWPLDRLQRGNPKMLRCCNIIAFLGSTRDRNWRYLTQKWTRSKTLQISHVVLFGCVNPLIPVRVIYGLDEPWPFFHFWRHPFWSKLASSIPDFCRNRKSFQWCADQSDRPNGAWYMHKNAQKVERKTQTKISCHYTWLLHGKNCPSRWRFLRSFKPEASPVEVQSLQQKEKKRRKRKGENKIPKIEKPKDVGHFREILEILISAHARVKML